VARVLIVATNREGRLWTVLPIGACIVADATAAAGHDVRVLDLRFAHRPAAQVRRAVRAFRPDVIGLSVRNIDSAARWRPVFYLPAVRDAVIPACRAESRAPIVAGGPAVTVGGAPLVDWIGADYGIAGEGEAAFPALVGALAAGTAPHALDGLLVRGTRPGPEWRPARAAQPAGLAPDAPARWLDAARYWRAGATWPVLTARGCPWSCTYCAYPGIEGHRARARAPADVAAEVAGARARGVGRFEIVDSMFSLPEPRALAMCEAIAGARGDAALEVAGLHPAGVTPRLLTALEAAGARGVLCTPDSFSEAGLHGLHKGFGMDVVERAAAVLREAPLDVCWFCILGAPGESLDDVRATLDYVATRLPPHHVVIVNVGLRVYAGTPLAAHVRAAGLIPAAADLVEPTWFIEPACPVDALSRLLADAAARCPNLVVMGEEAESGFWPRALLAWLRRRARRRARPAWAGLPGLFRALARWRDRAGAVRAGPAK
jgi:hypothetical protein